MEDDNNDSGRYRYDAFISYRWVNPDRQFARDLCRELESAGFKVALDVRDFDPAAQVLKEMERCVRESRFTLAVLSPRYLVSGYAEEEAIISQVLNIGERRRRLIPLVIEAVERPIWLFNIVGIDFTEEDPFIDPHERLRDTLGKAIKVKRDPGKPEPVPAPKPKKPQLPSIQNIHGWPAERVQALQRQTADAKNLSVVFRDGLKIGGEGPEIVVIPAGQFLMGSPEDEEGRDDDERQHEVKLTRPFAIGKYPVTVQEFKRFVETTGYRTEAEEGGGSYVWTGKEFEMDADAHWRTPGFEQKPDEPVVCVSWNDVQAYVQWFSQQTGNNYRLPTEAEWEYAARSGSSTAYCFGNDSSRLGEYAWYGGNSDGKTHPVGEKKPNAWGLHDMHGNVWEWVVDWYDRNYYANSPMENPGGPDAGSDRVGRGGGWDYVAGYCRSAFRDVLEPGFRDRYLGFRLSRLL